MEKMCNNSVLDIDREQTDNNGIRDEITYLSSPNHPSPVFGTVSAVKNVSCVSSPEVDIPSYQIPRNSKRFSDISEEQDLILPISPVCTPASIKKFENFEEPRIHTIGTIVKKNCGLKVNSDEEPCEIKLKNETHQYANEFEELGMLDKDISWDSSMETPAPPTLSLTDYNTIERATLLPENDVKNIQPRALFSPHKNDNLDCMPLKYSSESDGEGDSRNQLSSECQLLQDVSVCTVKGDDTLIASPNHHLLSNRHNAESGEQEVTRSPESPVFRLKKNTKRTRKLRALLVKSPVILESKLVADNDEKCKFDSEENDVRVHNSFYSEQSNSIQDDSFQNLSFSCIDELCKTSIDMSESNTINSTASIFMSNKNLDSEQVYNSSDLSLAKKRLQQGKFFYKNTEKSDELHPVLSVDCFLKSAKRLEEVDNFCENKIIEAFTDKEPTSFSEMVKEVPKSEISGQKRIRTEKTPEKNKIIKLDICRESEVEKIGQNVADDINSHFDANDSQMCLTAAYAESLINSTDPIVNNATKMGFNIDNEDEVNPNEKMKFPVFSTALGNSIPVSNDAYRKVRNIFKEDFEDDGNKSEITSKGEKDEKDDSFQELKTASSGSTVEVSEKSFNRAKNVFKEKTEFGFSTASGSKIKISEESLNKARKMLNDMDDKIDFEDSREGNLPDELRDMNFGGFKTASNKQIQISKESMKKVEALWTDEECLVDPGDNEIKNVIMGDLKMGEGAPPKFCGFSTASGRNVAVSSRALSNAKKLLGDIAEDEGGIEKAAKPSKSMLSGEKTNFVDEESGEIIPAWLHAYNTSPTLTMERLHLEAVTVHEDCQHSTPREQYLIKNPVLGITDRFYKRKRNPGRKLIFESMPKLEIPVESDLKPNFNESCKIGVRKRDVSDMGTDFAVLFKRRKLNDCDSRKLSEEVKEERRKARLEQIIAGKKGKVKPVKGSHLVKKSSVQMSWSEAVQGALPETHPKEALLEFGVREDVLAVTATTAADYKFRSVDFFEDDTFSNRCGFSVGDGCTLIFNDENMAGVEEFATAFFASPGVEPGLISAEWVKNHYRWIVWKLSHYERSFPGIFGGRCLTPHNVLVQLKYRYDREIDCSQRSALKKILEGDDSSAKRIVLCVCDIKKMSDTDRNHGDSAVDENILIYKLGLTDGWYSCYAQTDSAMTRLVEEGKIFVGAKLVTHGAEHLNCDKGISPLEAMEGLHLKIATNSTRRVKWDVKLGFQKNGGPILAYLNAILLNGGVVGRIDVVVARIYPVLYMEKKSDGTHVIRNSRMEDKAVATYQQQQEAAMDKIYEEVKEELRTKEREKQKHKVKLPPTQIKEVFEPEELYNLYENCPDPSLFQTLLTCKQKEILIDYQRRKTEISNKELSDIVQERIKSKKMSTRKVSQLLKIKLVDLHKLDYANPVLFTVWNSMEDVSRIFSEGKAISIFNTTPANSRFFNTVQLNSTRKTRYRELSPTVDYPARKLTRLEELTVDYEPDFNEVDIVGLVVAIHEASYGSRLSQTVFLADEGLNFAGIVFWGHCKDYGWENILTVSSIVACSNLQWSKRRAANCIPSVYVNDTSVFTENPKQNFLKEEIKRLRNALQEDKKSFVSKCAQDITTKLAEYKNSSNLSRNSPILSDSSLNSSSNVKPKYINGFRTKPNASSTPFKTACFGSDTSEPEPSPIQKRIEKLQIYGEPPPLSPLLSLDNLEKFKSKFRVPFKNVSAVDSTTK